MVRRRNAIIAVLVLLFAFTGVCVAVFLDHGGSGSLGSTLAIGILSPLAASMLVSGTGIVLQVRPANPPRESGFDGVVAVRPKKALTTEEWLGLLREARTEFFIAGHSLRKWCEASNQQEFKSKIRGILDDGGRVTLLMLAADSPQIGRLKDAPRGPTPPGSRRVSPSSASCGQSCLPSPATASPSPPRRRRDAALHGRRQRTPADDRDLPGQHRQR